MARPKKSDPELLLVSFCDILTISISGLFMATIITVFEATKVPELSMTPKKIATTKTALFLECRGDEVFFVDKEALDTKVAKLLSSLPTSRRGDMADFLKVVNAQDIGNEYYKIVPNYLLTAVMALEPRPGVAGLAGAAIESPDGKFQALLAQFDNNKYYIAFLVRDDSFAVFRKARLIADKIGFDTGWELLGSDEPIKFGSGGQEIGVSG
ncbi:MAG: hypothetical protein PCFJNLEI_01905 [Verrucomicrobiae bacterium]|nr:hypothetical protein [Verrucomicrobiae bacterium]